MRGHTLVELLLVLTLMGATTASLAPTALAYRDRSSVVAAREAMVGILSEARLGAMETGDARVRIETTTATATTVVRDSTRRAFRFRGELGVEVELGSGATDVELRFNALGLGSMAGQTIAFRRGAAATELVVSTYGRVRRR